MVIHFSRSNSKMNIAGSEEVLTKFETAVQFFEVFDVVVPARIGSASGIA